MDGKGPFSARKGRLGRIQGPNKGMSFGRETHILSTKGVESIFFIRVEPVSYTHLDVYKRQVYVVAIKCEMICLPLTAMLVRLLILFLYFDLVRRILQLVDSR